MAETGGASIEDLSLSQKELQSFKNSYEYDSPASSIMENIFPEVEAYNGGELSSNLFSLEVNQTPDTKKWTLKINPANKGTNSSEPSLIELDFSGQEGTQLKTNSNPEALLALQDLKTELDEVEDSFGALRTLVGRKAQDLIESKMTPEEHAHIINPLPGEHINKSEEEIQAIENKKQYITEEIIPKLTELKPKIESFKTRVQAATDKVWEAFFSSTIGDLCSELTPEKYPLAYSFLNEGEIDAFQVTSVEDILVGIGIFANPQMLDNFDPTITSKIKELQSEIPLSVYSPLQREKNSIETIKSINFTTKHFHQRRLFENELIAVSNSDLSPTQKANQIKEINRKITNSEKAMYFQDKYPELEQAESFLNSLSNSENPSTNPSNHSKKE